MGGERQHGSRNFAWKILYKKIKNYNEGCLEIILKRKLKKKRNKYNYIEVDNNK